jgi:hypothetical protein
LKSYEKKSMEVREGFVLFSEVQEELEFLKVWGAKERQAVSFKEHGKISKGNIEKSGNLARQTDQGGLRKAHSRATADPLESSSEAISGERMEAPHGSTLQAVLVARMLSKDRICLEKTR